MLCNQWLSGGLVYKGFFISSTAGQAIGFYW
jgi:hypothetical protein